MKKNFLLLFVFAISCQQPTAKKNTIVDDSHSAKNSIDYVGTYIGILPCADCHGLETELTINENSTFSIKTKYQGKGDKIYMQKGHFAWNKKGNTIILTDVKNGANQYFVGENTLTQLDIYGNKITGSLADEYILSKKSKNNSSAIETVGQKITDTVDLNSRMASTTVIQKVNPAVGKFTLAKTKWKLISLNGTKIIQKGTKDYFLKLDSSDPRFSAFAGCNNISGNYVMPSSDTIDFSDVIMTRMACDDMTIEDQFGAMLVQVLKYKVDANILTFFGEKKKVLAKFEASNQ